RPRDPLGPLDGRRVLARVRPVVIVAVTSPGCEPAHVRARAVAALELLLGRVAVDVLVPLVLLGDPEVDERAVPDVCESHCARDVTSRTGLIRPESAWRLLRRRPASPAWCPSRARSGRGARRARAGGGSTGATPPGRRRTAASSSGPARSGRAAARAPRARRPTSSARRSG